MDKDNSGVFENCNNHIREKLEILRHKLAGMISAAVEPCDEGECCESCKYFHSTACTDYLIADFLIANGVTVQEWISVGEPPKEWRRDNGEMINYHVPEYGVDIGNYGEPAKCWLCMGLPCKPTHWAPMPQPPKGVSGDG